MTLITEDKREILSVWYSNGENGWKVGTQGVTKIEPYHENGQMAAVTWLKIWKGDFLITRVNTALMEDIHYKPQDL